MADPNQIQQSMVDGALARFSGANRVNPVTRDGHRYINARLQDLVEEHLIPILQHFDPQAGAQRAPALARQLAEEISCRDLSANHHNLKVDETWAKALGFVDVDAFNEHLIYLANTGAITYCVGRTPTAGAHVRFPRPKRGSDGNLIRTSVAYFCSLPEVLTAIVNPVGQGIRMVVIACNDAKQLVINMLAQQNERTKRSVKQSNENYKNLVQVYRDAGFDENQVMALPMRFHAQINKEMFGTKSGRKEALQSACGFTADQVMDDNLRDTHVTRPDEFGLPFDIFSRAAAAVQLKEEIEQRVKDGKSLESIRSEHASITRRIIEDPNSNLNRAIKIVTHKQDPDNPESLIRRGNDDMARKRFCHSDDLDPSYGNKLGDKARLQKQRMNKDRRNKRKRDARRAQAQASHTNDAN